MLTHRLAVRGGRRGYGQLPPDLGRGQTRAVILLVAAGVPNGSAGTIEGCYCPRARGLGGACDGGETLGWADL